MRLQRCLGIGGRQVAKRHDALGEALAGLGDGLQPAGLRHGLRFLDAHLHMNRGRHRQLADVRKKILD